MGYLFVTLLIEPVLNEIKTRETRIDSLHTQIGQLADSIAEQRTREVFDPNRENLISLEKLNRRLARIQIKLDELTVDLIPPGQMVAMVQLVV